MRSWSRHRGVVRLAEWSHRAALAAAMVIAITVGVIPPLSATAAPGRTETQPGIGAFAAATDPAGVVHLLKDGGPASKAAAREALIGGSDAVDGFIATGQQDAIAQDYRSIALRLSLFGGHAVRTQAETVLTSDDAAAIKTFVTSGWQDAWAIDDRAAAYVLAGSGTPSVKRAANKALDSSSPDAVGNFLRTGQFDARIIDDRAAAYTLASDGTPHVVEAANAALDAVLADGSDDTEAVADFLRHGQFVAAARDAETASIYQLTNQAIAANRVAQEEQVKADEASAQAVLAARLAKEATERAAQQAQAAQGSAQKASAAASRAAALAAQAAEAADVAVDAAAAAHQAMNASMSAAGSAASAAAQAERAAANANGAAAAAAGQEANAAEARRAAEAARDAAKVARTAASAASQARTATTAAANAAAASSAASGFSGEAAGWATEASQASGVSSAAAAEARAAAARANAAKDRAASATARVDRLADETAQVALEARDAAAQASDHADAAAIEADTAADQASVAEGAADRATTSAQKAADAAEAATTAVAVAKSVFALAREADEERLAAEEEYGMQRAALAAEAEAEAQQVTDAAKQETAAAIAAGGAFLTSISAPGADVSALLPEARSALVAMISTGSAWVASAAARVIVGTDEEIVEFFTAGYGVALEQDQWDEVKGYLYASNAQLREESYDILENGEEFVADFLQTDVPAILDVENRQKAYALATDGGAEVQRQANLALGSDDPAVVAAFIAEGQYAALEIDQRAEAYALGSAGGPEVAAAANVALEGSRADLKRFLERGRFSAEKRDNDTAAHVAQMQSLLQLADAQAAASREAAAKAEEAAATARQAAAEAAASAEQARQYAQEARGWAAQAADSANRATASEQDARQSSQRAHQALDQAVADAKAANGYAASATASAQQAQQSAAAANNAAARAATSASNAGADAEAAAKAATEATQIAASKQRNDDSSKNYPPPPEQKGELTQAQIDAAFAEGGDAAVKRLKEAHALTQPNAIMDMIIKEGGQLLLDVLGVTDIMDCVTKGDFGACVMSIIGFAPWGKVAKLIGSLPLVAKIATKIIGFADKVKDAFTAIRRNEEKVEQLIAQACSFTFSRLFSRSARNCGPFDPEALTYSSWDLPHIKGQKGEAAAGIPYGEAKKTFKKDDYPDLDLTKDRIPDQVTPEYIMEVKNVKRQYYSLQVQDDIKLAEKTGKSEFILAINSETTLSPPLLKELCKKIDNPRLEMKISYVVKFLPETVGGELSGNVLDVVCARRKK